LYETSASAMSTRYSLLPEWAEQEAVLLAWPHQSTDWAPWLAEIQQDYVALTAAIAQEVTPIVLCYDAAHRDAIQSRLNGHCMRPPAFVVAAYNDTWCRDYGPLTLGAGQQRRLLDFRFNGWGEKYDADLDNRVNQTLASIWMAELDTVDFELEGGSIDTDGAGTLLTTRHCLLGGNRNTQLAERDIETLLLDNLGIERVLWLDHGALLGDDTDSHIDNLARFCDAKTIAFATCADKQDPHYEQLHGMQTELEKFRRPNGEPYRLLAIDIPQPQYDANGKRLPGSYINFLILNNCVIVPLFNCPQDQLALAALQQCFPGKRLLTVPGQNLIRQYGGPHCATMQLPKGTTRCAQMSDMAAGDPVVSGNVTSRLQG